MTNTVDEMRAKILFDVIKEPCGMDTILSTEDLCRDFKIGDGSVVNALKNINIEIEKGKLTLGIRYARTVTSTMSFAMPENFLEWNPTCHHNKNLLELGQQFVDLFKKQYLYMMYVWGHSYEFTNQNNWELMEDFCKLVGGRDDIWYATNIEIVDYLDAAKRLQYTADCSHVYNPSAASVWICVNDTNFIELKGGTMTELPIGEWAK